MWQFPRCVMGKSTRKSIETNYTGELMSECKPERQKLAKTRLCVL